MSSNDINLISNGGASNNAPLSFDPRNLEIKTRSIEQTLVPLVSQITTLINFKDSNAGQKKRNVRAALKVGTAVEGAIERFVSVGEMIGDENSDIQPEMYDACHEARLAGASIANLSCLTAEEINGEETVDKAVLIRAARQLLSSVTRVLLLADRVIVKHIIRAEDKVAYSLSRLENTHSFTEFVQIFAEFGGEMVDLAHKTGDRQHDLKSEKRRTQMAVARTALERTTMLLLTSSKTLLRHPESDCARNCRDGVFTQMRLALQLIAVCATDGILPLEADRYCPPTAEEPLDIGIQLTANAAIRQLSEMVEMVRMTRRVGGGVRERLVTAMDALCQLTQDFTDSAYTSHQHREQVLDFLEECRFEMTNLIQPDLISRDDALETLKNEDFEVTIERLNRRLKDLAKQLHTVAMEQLSEVFGANEDQVLMSSIKACAVSGDMDGVEKYLEKYREHAEHMQEVCRLLHHVSLTDALHVSTGHCERNLRAFAPLTILAGRTLCMHPSSRIARENIEVFCDMWSQLLNELSRLTKQCDGASQGRQAAERHAYMSLPRPGKHGTTQKPSKPMTLDVEDQQKMAKVGLEMKLLTSEVDAEAEKWDEYAENDIVKRAKAMSSMAYNMYLFTRGDGPLKTTHDLFTQAEFFAEQANKMYKTVREFSYEVPGSAEKSELSGILEKIPMHCQQLQVMVKSATVGKAATFHKVDSVIQETKNLMTEIAKLVTASFVCATKYEIEFRGTSMPRSTHGETAEPGRMQFDGKDRRSRILRTANDIESQQSTASSSFLSLYDVPPAGEISLEEFEACASERLQALRKLEELKVKYGSGNTEELKKAVYNELRNVFVNTTKRQRSNDDPSFENEKLEWSRKDRIGHFALRLAYCRNTEETKWFVNQEVELFRFRFQAESRQAKNDFFKSIKISGAEIMSEMEKEEKIELISASCGLSPDQARVAEIWKMDAMHALELVRSRRVFLHKGLVYLPSSDLLVTVIQKLRVIINAAMARANRYMSLVGENTRLIPRLDRLCKGAVRSQSDFDASSSTVTRSQLDTLSSKMFPLCMSKCHEALRKNHHLKHGARRQYGLFLKAIGLSLEEALAFFREEFTHKMDSDKFDKQYAYNIRHQYGKEGVRKDYPAFSCANIIVGAAPAVDDCHGCPFKHASEEELTMRLRRDGLSKEKIDAIIAMDKLSQFDKSCTLHFEAVRHLEPGSLGCLITHPNQYYQLAKDHASKGVTTQ